MQTEAEMTHVINSSQSKSGRKEIIFENMLFVPQYLNDGTAIDEATLSELKRLACRLFGGITVYSGHGLWKDESGTIYDEDVWIFLIITEDSNEEKLIYFAQTIKEKLGQMEIWLQRKPTSLFKI